MKPLAMLLAPMLIAATIFGCAPAHAAEGPKADNPHKKQCLLPEGCKKKDRIEEDEDWRDYL
jgi:hypothetical protein